MSSYVDKELFKKRFWNHVWEVNADSLRDLLHESNPVGHLNFGFVPPFDIKLSCENDRVFSKSPEHMKRLHFDRSFYFKSHNKKAVDILWDMLRTVEDQGNVYLPNGTIVDDEMTIVYTILVIYDHSPCQRVLFGDYPWAFDIVIHTILGLKMMAECWDETQSRSELVQSFFQEPDENIFPEHFQLMFALYTKHFVRFVRKFKSRFHAQDICDWIFERLDKDTDYLDNLGLECVGIWEFFLEANITPKKCSPKTMKRLWQLRCVQLDPERWPDIAALSDISWKELKAMYEGHPKNINIHDIDHEISDRPSKRNKVIH